MQPPALWAVAAGGMQTRRRARAAFRARRGRGQAVPPRSRDAVGVPPGSHHRMSVSSKPCVNNTPRDAANRLVESVSPSTSEIAPSGQIPNDVRPVQNGHVRLRQLTTRLRCGMDSGACQIPELSRRLSRGRRST